MRGTVTILVGSMTGTAELVAQEVAQELEAAGYAAQVLPFDVTDPSVLAGGGIYLVISSTYGNGEVPDNAQGFYSGLEADRPDLANILYGIIALGDMTYRTTFCDGGRKFDRLLCELGAQRVGEPLYHDASGGTMAEDSARAWAVTWIARELTPLLEAA